MTELEVLDKKLGQVIEPKTGNTFCNISEEFKKDIIKGISTIYDLNKEYNPIHLEEGVSKDYAGISRYVLPLNDKKMHINHSENVRFYAPYETFAFMNDSKLGCTISGSLDVPIHDEKGEISGFGYLTMMGNDNAKYRVYLYKSENNQRLITGWKYDSLKEAVDFMRTGNFEYILKNSDKFEKEYNESMQGKVR